VTSDRVVVGSCDGSVYCLAKRSGALLWAIATLQRRSIYSAPIVTKDSVYLAVAEGTVYCLSLEDGKVRWKYSPSETSELYSSPATDGTRIFVKSRPKNDGTGENSIFAIGPGK
jgi:outer membrane protein assembly factor BamB